MNTSTHAHSPSDLVTSIKPAMDSAVALNQVLKSVINDTQKLQSDYYAATFGDSMLALANAFSSGGAVGLAWQIPSWCQSQAEYMTRSMLDSFGVLAKSQQKILELMGASISQISQQTATAIAEMNATFASRRVSAQIIDFADRRAREQAESESAIHSGNGKKAVRQ